MRSRFSTELPFDTRLESNPPPRFSRSYGTEVMPNPARLATLQIVEAKKRWAMWALRGTEECRAYQADFCKHEKTGKALRVADLVVRPF